jgi:hypothetical protein
MTIWTIFDIKQVVPFYVLKDELLGVPLFIDITVLALLMNLNFKPNITECYKNSPCCHSELAKNLFLRAIRSFRYFLKASEIQSRQDDNTDKVHCKHFAGNRDLYSV